MKLLLSFLPWIIFLVLQHYTGAATALSVSIFVLILSPERKRLKKGFLVGWVVLLSMVGLLILCLVPFKVPVMLKTSIMTGSFAIMAWISLIVNKPFTIQYAKEEVPKDKWNTPGFLKVNQIVTAVWAIAMTSNTLLPIFGYHSVYVSIATILISIVFTKKFPEYYKKQAMKKQEKKTNEDNSR